MRFGVRTVTGRATSEPNRSETTVIPVESRSRSTPKSFRSSNLGTFADRLAELIGGPRRRNAFARECGLSETSLRQYLAGGVPGLDKVIQIARAKNVHVEWLATGEGPRDIQPKDRVSLSPERTEQEHVMGGMVQSQQLAGTQDGMVLLPYLSVVASAGQGIVPADEEIGEFLALKEEFLRQLGINPRNAHVLQIKGDSMYPTFRDHDVIVIDASLIDVREEGLYTLVYDDAVFAKRIQPLRDGTLRIVSDNKAAGYVDEIVSASERHTLKIVGRIRGVYRNL